MKQLKKIIVVKQGGIGDVILATPVIAELKKRYPNSYITLLIKPNAVDLIQGLPFIDEVFAYDKAKMGFWQLWKKMRGNDAAILLDLTYRPAMAAAIAGVPIRVGIEHKRKFWLTKKIKWQESMDHTYEPYVFANIVNQGLDIQISYKNLDRPYIVDATEMDCQDLNRKLQKYGKISLQDKYVVCSPVTAFYLKNWSLEKWAKLFQQIYQEYGIKTVIFGSGDMKYPWNEETVVNLWDRLNLRQTGELVKNALLLVNCDSMPLHLAAAKDVPTVVLEGPMEPKRWAPRKNCEVVQANLPCVPCDGYHGTSCTNPQCMKSITVDEVWKACKKQFQKMGIKPCKKGDRG